MEHLEKKGNWEERFTAGAVAVLPYLLLSVVTLLLLFLPVPEGALFGSEGDWYSQHVGAADALRQTMLRQGTIFPQFIGLAGGANSYDLAYYGLLRPDILISCLLPEISMRYIISTYAVIGAAASVNLTYTWLKRKNLSIWFSMGGGLLMAGATCFFHTHHQIMFINYMPFLILALMGIDRVFEKKKTLLLSVSVFLICMHSFYYAPTCMAVCLLYGIQRLLQKGAQNRRQKFHVTVKAVISVLLGIGAAAVLLLPTALDIFSTAKDAGAFLEEPIHLIDVSFISLLYQPYGCGMTLAALYCLLLSLKRKGRRMISASLLVILTIPAIWFICSGFLYPRAKILIPLVPLIIWICADTLQAIYRKEQKACLIPALLCIVPAVLLQEKALWAKMAYIDLAVVLVFAAVHAREKIPAGVKKGALALLIFVPLCVNYGVNTNLESYLQKDDPRQSRFSYGDITMFSDHENYRFDYLANNYTNSNILPDGDINKTAGYLSVTNSRYADFYYNTMGNPISLRNRVVLMPNQNSLFNYFMGIRFILTEEDRIPYGYKKVFARNGFALAENPDVLPICYGTDKLLPEAELEKMEYAEKLTALCGVKAKKRKPEEVFAREFPTKYEETEAGKLVIPLKKIMKDKALILSFDIDRHDGRETCITINRMKNNLSAKSASYPNRNDTFHFVLSDEKGLKTLETELTKGDYDIKNLQVFEADIPSPDADHIWSAVPQNRGKQVFQGSVLMKRDGYFVTSYPYKKGFHVTVDGKPVKGELVNTTFLGFPLKEGKHRIQIGFTAPGFEEGKVISLLSLAALALMTAMEYLRERKRKQ